MKAKCDLCKKILDPDNISELGKLVLHPKCYQLAILRLTPFINVLFGTEEEWQEWLKDE